MIQKIYPLISLTSIEILDLISKSNTILTILIFTIQLIIGFLTVLKLYLDIKSKLNDKTKNIRVNKRVKPKC